MEVGENLRYFWSLSLAAWVESPAQPSLPADRLALFMAPVWGPLPWGLLPWLYYSWLCLSSLLVGAASYRHQCQDCLTIPFGFSASSITRVTNALEYIACFKSRVVFLCLIGHKLM